MKWQPCSCSGVCSKGVRNTCVPSNSPTSKLSNAKRYEGVTTMCELALESRERTAVCVEEELEMIHPFNDSRIIRLFHSPPRMPIFPCLFFFV
jgi:threonine dehydratase